jgi:hypothetical protein
MMSGAHVEAYEYTSVPVYFSEMSSNDGFTETSVVAVGTPSCGRIESMERASLQSTSLRGWLVEVLRFPLFAAAVFWASGVGYLFGLTTVVTVVRAQPVAAPRP